MVCRSNAGNSAATSLARMESGLDDVQTLSLFHRVLRENAGAPAPDADALHGSYASMLRRIAGADLTEARRQSLRARVSHAMSNVRPDGPTFAAWNTIAGRALLSRAALDHFCSRVAVDTGMTAEQVRGRMDQYAAENRALGRSAPAAPAEWVEQVLARPAYADLPADRGTMHALHRLYAEAGASGAQTYQSVQGASASAPGSDALSCPSCGQFAGTSHVCPDTGAHAAAPSAAPVPAVDADGGTAPSGTSATTRTPYRTYRGDHADVRILNLSAVREQAAEQSSAVQDVQVTLRDQDARFRVAGEVEIVDRRSTGEYTPGLRTGNPRRVERFGASDRSLRCTCPEYQARYACPHVDQALAQVSARLNNLPEPAPQAAVDQVSAELAAEFDASQQAIAAQQQAVADAAPCPSYSEDMDAFQDAYAEAKRRIDAGESPLPYLTENALGGLGDRQGGRSFGIEIEVDFPDDPYGEAKARVAAELHAAGLSRSPEVRPWHWIGRGGGGYTDAPDNWSAEYDRTVDLELVSPILYDEPQTWENLRKVCEIVERNGGRATTRTGGHVNVGAGDFDHTVENHNRLLAMAQHYDDVLVRLGHNPEFRRHRGRRYCLPNEVPAAGYRRISDARQLHREGRNGHLRMLNLSHLPDEDSPVTGSTRVEVRVFDGTLDPARIQHNVRTSLALVNAALRGEQPDADAQPEPQGTHRNLAAARPNPRRRLSGEEWREDTKSIRSLVDKLFTREADKRMTVAGFAASRWQQG